MTDVAATAPLDEDSFFELIATREGRFELHDGVIYAMAGGTRAHALISSRALRALGNLADRRGCEAYGPDFYIGITNAHGRDLVSPDAWVRCGPSDPQARSADDPVVVVEVLSPSTMAFDRGGKLELYFSIPSLQHVLLVYQHAMRVELWSRTPREGREDSWEVTHHEDPAGDIPLAALEGTIPLRGLYEGLDLTL